MPTNPKRKIHPSITLDRIVEAVERRSPSLDNPGFCIACGEDAEGVAPDARHYRCEACGERAVYGAEELLPMMNAIEISVTAEDIKQGEPCNGILCPVARAIERITGLSLKVGIEFVEFSDGREAALPKIAQDFIWRFDVKDPVEPFTFTLEEPK